MKNQRFRKIFILVLGLFLVMNTLSAAEKPRIIVFSDIGAAVDGDGDPDDNQSMVRLLLHSNELNILGLISSLSTTNRKYQEQFFEEPISAFESDRDNLQIHAALLPQPYNSYPTADDLRSVVRGGGDAGTSEYVTRMIRESTDDIWLLAWGGLKEIDDALDYAKTQPDYDEIIGRVHIYAIAKQDDEAIWGARDGEIYYNHPGIGLFIWNTKEVRGATSQFIAFSDSSQLKNWVGTLPESIEDFFNHPWVDANVQSAGHGNLGAYYPDPAYIYEGDSPSFLHVLSQPMGLSNPTRPDWGGWGGRFLNTANVRIGYINPTNVNGNTHLWSASKNDSNWEANDSFMGVTDALVPQWRWRPAYQNEFAARLDWAGTSDVTAANHPPVITSSTVDGNPAGEMEVNKGTSLALTASVTDPDGDSLSYRWWIYGEADYDNNRNDNYTGSTAIIRNANTANATLDVPDGHLGKKIHVILEVTDDGTPPLTRYSRHVLTVSEGIIQDPPAAPSEPEANPVSENRIDLSWTDPADNESYFRIERDEGDGFSEVTILAANITRYEDTGLNPSTIYAYRVLAGNSAGESAFSETFQATTLSPDVQAPSVPGELTAYRLGSRSVDLFWEPSTDNRAVAGYRIYRDGSLVAETTASPATLGALEPGTVYAFSVTAVDVGGNESPATESVTVATLPASLPGVWTSEDIGSVGLAGSSVYESETDLFQVEGAGLDIWGTADAFRFVHQNRSGDFELSARVDSLTDTDMWAKAGLMARAGNVPDAANVLILVSPDGYVRFQARSGDGNATGTQGTVTNEPPVWLRLVRSGTSYSGFYSPDGVNWNQVGDARTVSAIGETGAVGLAVTSHNTAERTTAVFGSVTLNGVGTGSGTGGFSSWADAHGVVAEETDDGDGDGVPALVEYALGGSPHRKDFSLIGLEGMNFIFRKSAEARANGDVTYTVEVSSTLSSTRSWTPVDPAELVESGVEGERVSVSLIMDGEPSLFVRLSVSGEGPDDAAF